MFRHAPAWRIARRAPGRRLPLVARWAVAYHLASNQVTREPTVTRQPNQQVFVAYSHRDAAIKDEIVKQLQVALYELSFDTWDDTRIGAGDVWRQEIETAVDHCAAALLLVSVDSLTSKFILEDELPRLLHRRLTQGLPVFPILVRSCPWKNVAWLERLEVRPKDGLPLGERTDAAARMADIATEIAARLRPGRAGTPVAPRIPAGPAQTTAPPPVPQTRVAVPPQGLLQPPSIQHNVSYNGVSGMHIVVKGMVEGALGANAQVATRFFMPNGQPLFANVQERWYRDTAGWVSAYTTPFPITQDPFEINALMPMPYYALNLVPTGMSTLYALTLQADLYLNGVLALRSAHSPFSVYW